MKGPFGEGTLLLVMHMVYQVQDATCAFLVTPHFAEL